MILKKQKIRFLGMDIFTMLLMLLLPLGAARATEPEALANIQLAGLSYDLVLAEFRFCEENPEFMSILSKSILRKIALVRISSPEISKLNGKSLETLCMLEQNSALFLDQQNVAGSANSMRYLTDIKSEVRERIAQLQKKLKGEGCLISPI